MICTEMAIRRSVSLTGYASMGIFEVGAVLPWPIVEALVDAKIHLQLPK